MASRRREKEEKIELMNVSPSNTRNVKDRIKQIEQTNPDPKSGINKSSSKCSIVKRAVGSRFIGIFLGPLFGVFLYYYITYLVLSGPPFTKEVSVNGTFSENEIKTNITVDGEGFIKKEVVLMDNSLRYNI